MKKPRVDGGFIVCLLINMLFNIEWTIPAWVLLFMHFWRGWSLWWFVGALAIWFLVIFLWMAILGWASSGAMVPDPPKENKNPYSVKTRNPYDKSANGGNAVNSQNDE